MLLRSAAGQMMAHPGWRGNGIGNAVWWHDAVFVREESGTTLEVAASHLDSFVAAGADAVILPTLAEGDDLAGVDATEGTAEQMDNLLREAAARRMHVLVALPLDRLRGAADGGESVVRSWLARGVAGIDLGQVPPERAADVRRLRALVDRTLGQRLLLAKGDPPTTGADPVTLRIVKALDFGAVAAAQNRAVHAVEVEAAGDTREGELHIAELLLQTGPPLLSASLVLQPSPNPDWLPRVLSLRRTLPALRRGTLAALQTDVPGTFASVARPVLAGAQPMLIVGNGSAEPVTLHLQPQVAALRLRGYFLRALLRNDGGMGPVSLANLQLPAHAVVVGELRY